MQIIDTHCHYNMEPLYHTWREHWHKAQAQGVEKAIVVGTDLESSQRAVEIAESENHLYAAVGIHPHDTAVTPDTETIISLLSRPKVIAVGETGLDYFRLPEDENAQFIIEAQQAAFRTHIDLAHQYHKLLIVHVRDQETPETPTKGNAYWDALTILKEYYPVKPITVKTAGNPYANGLKLIEKYSASTPPQSLDFILHCISGPLTYCDEAIKLGAYVGVAGNVTYTKANRIREIIKRVPVSHLLLETDAPFLPPQPYRGQVCEPWMIVETVRQVASLP